MREGRPRGRPFLRGVAQFGGSVHVQTADYPGYAAPGVERFRSLGRSGRAHSVLRLEGGNWTPTRHGTSSAHFFFLWRDTVAPPLFHHRRPDPWFRQFWFFPSPGHVAGEPVSGLSFWDCAE